MPDVYALEDGLVCGCDEAGRGCLAGPVVAAAVILPQDFHHPLLNDSKKVKESDRDKLAEYIRMNALHFGIGVVTHEEIDQINILKASFLAMHRALDVLDVLPDVIIVDGNRFTPYKGVRHECHVKGDARFAQISAASILAKTHRDALMNALDEVFPAYQWKRNKGYPTIDHRAAIEEYGPSVYHRMSFRLLKDKPLTLFDDESQR